MSWRLLNTGRRPGAWNMALDMALIDSVQDGRSRPVVRFYDWERPTVSLGYNQKVAEVDLDYCKQHGIDVVRRPTGGRAVFHNEEFTYSVIAREDEPVLAGRVMDSYLAIGRALLEGLSILGVRAQMQRSESRGQSVKSSPLCFAAAGRYEITVQNRKLLGSAQRRMNGVILQQGSLLLRQAQTSEMFLDKSGMVNAITVQEVLARPVGYDEASRAMEQGFKKAWSIEIEHSAIAPAEEKAALTNISSVKIL